MFPYYGPYAWPNPNFNGFVFIDEAAIAAAFAAQQAEQEKDRREAEANTPYMRFMREKELAREESHAANERLRGLDEESYLHRRKRIDKEINDAETTDDLRKRTEPYKKAVEELKQYLAKEIAPKKAKIIALIDELISYLPPGKKEAVKKEELDNLNQICEKIIAPSRNSFVSLNALTRLQERLEANIALEAKKQPILKEINEALNKMGENPEVSTLHKELNILVKQANCSGELQALEDFSKRVQKTLEITNQIYPKVLFELLQKTLEITNQLYLMTCKNIVWQLKEDTLGILMSSTPKRKPEETKAAYEKLEIYTKTAEEKIENIEALLSKSKDAQKDFSAFCESWRAFIQTQRDLLDKIVAEEKQQIEAVEKLTKDTKEVLRSLILRREPNENKAAYDELETYTTKAKEKINNITNFSEGTQKAFSAFCGSWRGFIQTQEKLLNKAVAEEKQQIGELSRRIASHKPLIVALIDDFVSCLPVDRREAAKNMRLQQLEDSCNMITDKKLLPALINLVDQLKMEKDVECKKQAVLKETKEEPPKLDVQDEEDIATAIYNVGIFNSIWKENHAPVNPKPAMLFTRTAKPKPCEPEEESNRLVQDVEIDGMTEEQIDTLLKQRKAAELTAMTARFFQGPSLEKRIEQAKQELHTRRPT